MAPLLPLVLLIATAVLAAADAPAATQTGTPRRLLIGDSSTRLLAIVNADGSVGWQEKVGEIHDAWLLADGNVLFQTNWTRLVEMTPTNQVVWEYDAGKANGNTGRRVEVHAFQRLADGVTMIVESGPARIIEVDRAGKLLVEVPLTVKTRNPHTDTRQARKLPGGTYLVCHESDHAVREYDAKGTVVWEHATGAKVYSAQRLANGNTLIGAGNGHRVYEVDRDGKEVWAVNEKDLPGITLVWVTMVDRLPNGNTVLVNCHAGPTNPQIIEVNPAKQVVWTFKDFTRFGNALPVARVLD